LNDCTSATSTNLICVHAALPKRGPQLRAALAAACTGEVWFDVGEPDIIGLDVSVGFDVVAAAVIAAIDHISRTTDVRISPKVIFCGLVVIGSSCTVRHCGRLRHKWSSCCRWCSRG